MMSQRSKKQLFSYEMKLTNDFGWVLFLVYSSLFENIDLLLSLFVKQRMANWSTALVIFGVYIQTVRHALTRKLKELRASHLKRIGPTSNQTVRVPIQIFYYLLRIWTVLFLVSSDTEPSPFLLSTPNSSSALVFNLSSDGNRDTKS